MPEPGPDPTLRPRTRTHVETPLTGSDSGAVPLFADWLFSGGFVLVRKDFQTMTRWLTERFFWLPSAPSSSSSCSLSSFSSSFAQNPEAFRPVTSRMSADGPLSIGSLSGIIIGRQSAVPVWLWRTRPGLTSDQQASVVQSSQPRDNIQGKASYWWVEFN